MAPRIAAAFPKHKALTVIGGILLVVSFTNIITWGGGASFLQHMEPTVFTSKPADPSKIFLSSKKKYRRI
jgi:hypothetical protein